MVGAVPLAYSSGPISVVVRPAGVAVGTARFTPRAPVERIVVRVRAARPAGSRLRLELVAPDGAALRLPFRHRAAVACRR